jgi:pimeloyl-ACP methyl ester carboxylesterase
VGDVLRAAGHAVTAPDLPKQAPAWGLRDYAAEIARSVNGPDTVVVGHSFSGVFLPLVAQERDCALIVFLAAVIPESGKSVRDQFAEDPGMFSHDWIEAGPRWFDRLQQASLAKEFLFHDCDEETLRWALGTVELFDTRNLAVEPAPFTKWPDVPAVSVVCADDRTLTADWGRRVSQRVLGRKTVDIQAGHCPHVSQSREIARLLEQLAGGGSA